MILVTGAAGFIGYHLTKLLLSQGKKIVGLDNINDYYDVNLKYDRLNQLGILKQNIIDDNINETENFHFIKADLTNHSILHDIFAKYNFTEVIHLAAQAGVRYSLENPKAYIDSNLIGFSNVIELSKKFNVKHFMYASSSSVYGNNQKIPFSTNDNVDYPISLYAATKKSNELIAHTYSHLYELNTTGLRFFTVYGPWGRPDMAYFKFANAIFKGLSIDVYNHGDLIRDFTYIDDILEGIDLLIKKGGDGYKVYNIGNNKPVKLLNFIEIIESLLNKKAKKNMLPMQKGDVYTTYADIDPLKKYCGYQPKWEIQEGLKEFVLWYQQYFSPHVR